MIIIEDKVVFSTVKAGSVLPEVWYKRPYKFLSGLQVTAVGYVLSAGRGERPHVIEFVQGSNSPNYVSLEVDHDLVLIDPPTLSFIIHNFSGKKS